MSAAVLKANRDIIEISRTSQAHRGMGTTVVAACFSARSGLMHVAHVGDSRCYRLRAGHLELLTQDHSLLTDVIEQRPELDDALLARLPKNVVTRALGIPSLQEETSRSASLGMVWKPSERFSLTADVFRIDIDDRIIFSGNIAPEAVGTDGLPCDATMVLRGA